MVRILIAITFIAAMGSLWAYLHPSQQAGFSADSLECGEGWTKLAPEEVPTDQLPKDLKDKMEGQDADFCIRKAPKSPGV